jgi:phosphatidylinositol 3-kinase
MKKFDRGDLPKNDWLDVMAFRRIEEIHAVGYHISQAWHIKGLNPLQVEEAKSENLYLYIDLPKFEFPVVFNEIVRKVGLHRWLLIDSCIGI